MSLRTITEKCDAVICAVTLTLSALGWAVAGFPHIEKVVAFGCLAAVCFGAYQWMESRS